MTGVSEILILMGLGMDWLHLKGLICIHFLQSIFKDDAETMLFITKLGDPKAAFLVYFPLSYIIKPSVGIKVVWVGVVTELVNTVMKWFLHGERPYWWIHETPLLDTPPDIQQYRLTCETGPGSPSGHCMVTAGVLYVMIAALLTYKFSKSKHRSLVASVCWFLLIVYMSAIGISRCFIATHFPHQVVAGTITGAVIAAYIVHMNTSTQRLLHFILGAMGVLGTGFGLYAILIQCGVNPQWSVTLAEKHCLHKEWIYLDTTPFFALVKDASALLGLGLALYANTNGHPDSVAMSTPVKAASIMMALTLTQASEFIKLPQSPEAMFYVLGFIKNAFVVYGVVLIRSLMGHFLGKDLLKKRVKQS